MMTLMMGPSQSRFGRNQTKEWMNTLLIFLLLIFIVEQAIAEVPEWTSTGSITEYSDQSRYIVSVGMAQSLNIAEKLAFAKLVEQVKVDVSGQSRITKGFSSNGTETLEYESIDVDIRSSVSLNGIEGIQIVARHLDSIKNRYYVFAILDRVKAANALAFKLDSLFSQVDAVQADMYRFIKSDNPSKGFRSLVKISGLFQLINSDLVMHQLFASGEMKAAEGKRYLDRIRSHDRYLSALFVDVDVLIESEDIQLGSSGLGAEEPFLLSFTYQSKPIRFVPIRIDVKDDGYLFETGETTDGNGKLLVKVQKIPYTGNQTNRINVELAVTNEIFNSIPPSAQLTIMLNRKSDVTILLSVRFLDPNYSNLAPVIESSVKQLLSGQNFNLAPSGGTSKPDYELSIQAKVLGYPGYDGLKFVEIGGVVEIKSSKTNKILKIINIQSGATKAGGLSAYQAAEKSAVLVADVLRQELFDELESVIGR